MPGSKGLRPTSPVHVHVDDDVPVHVHVKQPKKKKGGVTSTKKFTKSTISSRARSKSPSSGPWVPPPAKATKGSKVSWQVPEVESIAQTGPTHRLEIHTPRDALRMEDLSTDEEDRVHSEMRTYENKIENLMSEVGTLKNEVELQRTLRENERQEDELNTSRRILEEQERELDDYRDELTHSSRENRLLKQSMGILRDEADAVRTEADLLNREREKVMKKLIEVEMDGQCAAKHASQLRDLVRKFRQ
ncbi:outer dense fiber protein 2-like, partial [Ruditapes philippinarum]